MLILYIYLCLISLIHLYFATRALRVCPAWISTKLKIWTLSWSIWKVLSVCTMSVLFKKNTILLFSSWFISCYDGLLATQDMSNCSKFSFAILAASPSHLWSLSLWNFPLSTSLILVYSVTYYRPLIGSRGNFYHVEICICHDVIVNGAMCRYL